ncbi:hypothetical protein ACFQ07_34155 [Actinomadura adrarensis]|uniref:Uncharacterized protein n=1 Tax=Actinomadura adrarensis TaxID=1819600 RepID=A0ABW3CUN4_9ACTN
MSANHLDQVPGVPAGEHQLPTSVGLDGGQGLAQQDAPVGGGHLEFADLPGEVGPVQDVWGGVLPDGQHGVAQDADQVGGGY